MGTWVAAASQPSSGSHPTRRSTILALALATALLGSCSGYQAGVTDETPSTEAVPRLEAVSRSNPSDEAKLALDACGITGFDPDHEGSGLNLGIDVVAGMALVSPASEANSYVPLGKAPELESDKALWVIATKGWITLGPFASGPAENPTCVVIDGEWGYPTWYLTGDSKVGIQLVTPLPAPSPRLKLPALAP